MQSGKARRIRCNHTANVAPLCIPGTASIDEIQQRIATAQIEELDAIGERLLTVSTLQEALGH